MDLTLTDDQELIASTARDFLEARCPMAHVRQMETDPTGYSPALWKEMAGLGWTGLALPEEHGGAGGGFLDLCLVVEQMGRVQLPSPFLPTVVLCGLAVAAHGTDEQRASRVGGIAQGDTIMSYVRAAPGGGWGPSGSEVMARRDGDGFVLDGTAMFVPYAHVADELLVVARLADGAGERGHPGAASDLGDPGAASDLGDPGDAGAASDLGDPGDAGAVSDLGDLGDPGAASDRGDSGGSGRPGVPGDAGDARGADELTAFLVAGDAEGLSTEPLGTVSPDHQHRVVFDGVRVAAGDVLGGEGGGAAVVATVDAYGAAATCAAMVGGAQRVLDMTVQYATEREQFGTPVGAFQAVQHHCANMGVDVLSSRLIAYEAVWRLSEGLDAGEEVSMAKAWVSEAYRRVCALGHQVHGAIGFTREHDLHYYYRHAVASELAFGDGDHHWGRIADHLGLPE